ncbi:response regulator receiver modulated metal dependent phosphohydrolase [Magnetococcus marinus MC-1]|uniref:Response regulator receiver modulated metal dependent phosphohydrolase n=1 Tax=Magnetococcus marinus (strain ATCC BAA-1437 / JCM 17883 / MC-1) TaxID=156889 RepID=A0LD51_MAGMM|nr:two-component system response regulator [Magnetococcus marinus]ABK45894.1 response regulator receiver modulated metal dependent phosphohydrolase [Magnetococcus marinus MC-1]
MGELVEKATLLVVDDTPENIEVLSGVLRSCYRVKAALNGEKALRIAAMEPRPDMILLDVMMPGMDGYEVCRRLKADPITAHIPVIFVTAKATVEDELEGLQLGAVDYITKPISPPIVELRVRTQLALYDQQRELERMVQVRTEQLVQTRLEIIRRLGRAAEFKDNETGLHVIRMSHYARLMAEALNISAQWTELVFNAAPMHDIGKIGIPDHVLLKPGKLDDEEWLVMRRHPVMGAEIIGDHDSELMSLSKEISLTHHEKWDGSGYPHGLRGEQIPLAGRIVAIADVFDALTSERPYKKAWSVEKAVEIIEKDAGTHFDPSLVPVFLKTLPEALEIKARYGESSHG